MGIFRIVKRLFLGSTPKRVARKHESRSNRLQPKETFAASPVQEASVIEGTCWVVDGDTIMINKLNIRLAGIDAPELDHPYGKNAKWALRNLCKDQIIRAELTGDQSYERVVARCYLADGRDLAAEMVKAGHALDWPKHSGGRYRQFESADVRKRLWRVDARQKGRLKPQN